jgi:hypothetical protein
MAADSPVPSLILIHQFGNRPWRAPSITIIALSQSSPLNAIAELVENSIDAKASTVTITRPTTGMKTKESR